MNSSTNESVGNAGLVLGMMAKFWTVGAVKTRLGRTTGMHQSARIHKLFVQVLSENLASAADHRVAVVTPSQKINRFAQQISPEWTMANQSDGDLGQRMMHWFVQTLVGADTDTQNRDGLSGSTAVLIGADCPMIDQAAIDSAGEALQSHDVVLGPALDGGYYLIGLRGPWKNAFEQLFDSMPWSTEDVLPLTMERCKTAGLSVATLEEREDIDTIDSLNRLCVQLRSASTTNDGWGELADQIETILSKEPSE